MVEETNRNPSFWLTHETRHGSEWWLFPIEPYWDESEKGWEAPKSCDYDVLSPEVVAILLGYDGVKALEKAWPDDVCVRVDHGDGFHMNYPGDMVKVDADELAMFKEALVKEEEDLARFADETKALFFRPLVGDVKTLYCFSCERETQFTYECPANPELFKHADFACDCCGSFEKKADDDLAEAVDKSAAEIRPSNEYKFWQSGIAKMVQKLENDKDDLGFVLATLALPRNRKSLLEAEGEKKVQMLNDIFGILDKISAKHKKRWEQGGRP
jgi:hypothetical protein